MPPPKEQESGAGGEDLGQGVADPEGLPAQEQRQEQGEDGGPEEAPGQGDGQRAAGALGGLPVGDHEDTEAGQEEAGEVEEAPPPGEVHQGRAARSRSPWARLPDTSTPAPAAMAMDRAMRISMRGTETAAAAMALVPRRLPMKTPSTIT